MESSQTQKPQNKSGSSIEELARILNRTMANVMPNNIEQNVTVWDNYAREWSTEKDFVKNMIKDT